MNNQSKFTFKAEDYILVATKGSKYAHAPHWNAFSSDVPQSRPACSTQLPSLDKARMSNEDAEGKPPCPRCIRILRHHLAWMTHFVEAYDSLTWEDTE